MLRHEINSTADLISCDVLLNLFLIQMTHIVDLLVDIGVQPVMNDNIPGAVVV